MNLISSLLSAQVPRGVPGTSRQDNSRSLLAAVTGMSLKDARTGIHGGLVPSTAAHPGAAVDAISQVRLPFA